jgi:hypothetical protein
MVIVKMIKDCRTVRRIIPAAIILVPFYRFCHP